MLRYIVIKIPRKEFYDLDIYKSDIIIQNNFEKHLRLVSKAASLKLGILRKSWKVFHDRSLLERCFRGFVMPVWSTVLQSGAQLPIHTLNYWTVQSVVPGS